MTKDCLLPLPTVRYSISGVCCSLPDTYNDTLNWALSTPSRWSKYVPLVFTNQFCIDFEASIICLCFTCILQICAVLLNLTRWCWCNQELHLPSPKLELPWDQDLQLSNWSAPADILGFCHLKDHWIVGKSQKIQLSPGLLGHVRTTLILQSTRLLSNKKKVSTLALLLLLHCRPKKKETKKSPFFCHHITSCPSPPKSPVAGAGLGG